MGHRTRGTPKNWPLHLRCLCEGGPPCLADCPFLLHRTALHAVTSEMAVTAPGPGGSRRMRQGLGLSSSLWRNTALAPALPSTTQPPAPLSSHLAPAVWPWWVWMPLCLWGGRHLGQATF